MDSTNTSCILSPSPSSPWLVFYPGHHHLLSKLFLQKYSFDCFPSTFTLNILSFILFNLSLTYSSVCHQVILLKHSLKQFINTMLKTFSRLPILFPLFHMTLHDQCLPWSGPSSLYSPLTCVSATQHIHRSKAHFVFSLVYDSIVLPDFFKLKISRFAFIFFCSK